MMEQNEMLKLVVDRTMLVKLIEQCWFVADGTMLVK